MKKEGKMIYLNLLWMFFKIGLFTFGGGYAMIPMIHDEVVNGGMIDNDLFLNMVAISESTPGPFSINIATFVGMEQAGVAGAACATIGVVLPSFLVIVLIAYVFKNINKKPVVRYALEGVRPVVVSLIGYALISVAASALFANVVIFDTMTWGNIDVFGLVLAIAVFVLCRFKKLHPVVILLGCALIGGVGYFLLDLTVGAAGA